MNYHSAPTAVGRPRLIDARGNVRQYIYDAEYTRYHVVVVEFGDIEFVMAEPAGLQRRGWLPLSANSREYISEEYVSEKLGVIGVDAHCLTLLIAFATGRTPIFEDGTLEPIEGV